MVITVRQTEDNTVHVLTYPCIGWPTRGEIRWKAAIVIQIKTCYLFTFFYLQINARHLVKQHYQPFNYRHSLINTFRGVTDFSLVVIS